MAMFFGAGQDDTLNLIPFPPTNANVEDDRTCIETYLIRRFYPIGM